MNSPALETPLPDTENILNSSFSIDPKQKRPQKLAGKPPSCMPLRFVYLVVITLENYRNQFPENLFFIWHTLCNVTNRQARFFERDPPPSILCGAACRCARSPPSDPSDIIPKMNPVRNDRVSCFWAVCYFPVLFF